MIIGIMSLFGDLGWLYLVSVSVVQLHVLWLVVIEYSVGVGWLFVDSGLSIVCYVHIVLCPLS